MKIKFQEKEWKNAEDELIFNESLSVLNDLNEANVYLLKDSRTEFKHFRENEHPDIKSVYILIEKNNFKIKIKGNLSLNNYQIAFYPIFVDKYDSFDQDAKFRYKFDLSKIDNTKLGKFEMLEANEKAYANMVEEFKNDKYTPTAALAEWKDFMEPYEYYVDLKFELLKQDFEFLDNFDTKYDKLILVTNSNKDYINLKENNLYEYLYEDNKGTTLFLDYEKNKNKFDEHFLNRNSRYIAKAFYKYNKEQKAEAENKIYTLNNKFKSLINKISFFTTNEVYVSDDLKKDGKMSKMDEELIVDLAFAKELYENFSNIDTRSSTFKSILSKMNPIIIKGITSAKDFKNIVKGFENILSLNKEFEVSANIIKNDLNKNINFIDDSSIEYVNSVLYELNNVDIKSFKNEIEEFSEYINQIKDIEEKFNKKLSDEKSKLDKIKFDSMLAIEDKKEKKVIENKIDKNNKIHLSEKEDEFNLLIEKEIMALYEKKLKNRISTINKIIENNSKCVHSVAEVITSGIAQTVEYTVELNIIFSFKDEIKPKIKKNIYLLNTGDMVLIDTIRRINAKIKKSEDLNNNILYKIIEKEKLNKFEDYSNFGSNKNFVPADYEILNESQKFAFRLAIDMNDPISIIQGPPGTGKTEVITNIIKFFRNKGEKVLISSQTNVALKNVLDKLCSYDKNQNSLIIPWLTTNVNEDYSVGNIDSKWYEKVLSNIEMSDVDVLPKWKLKMNELAKDNQILSQVSLVEDIKAYAATTTTSVTLPGRGYSEHLSGVKILIIDEVSKSILPEILRYALDVEKVILVGDYKQLNPIFDIDDKKIKGKIDKVRFDKLKKEIQSGIFFKLANKAKEVNRIATLDVNYRSVPGVLDAYNIFYEDEGGLEANRKFSDFSENYKFNDSKYFESNKSLYFIDVQGATEQKRGESRFNRGEINEMITSLWDLATTLENPEEKSVAIIFPYAAQIQLFESEMKKPENKKLRDLFKNFRWDTVDSFQGSEANIVFLSTVITDGNSRNFLSDFRRINVSMSRAKDMLVIFGNMVVLKQLEIGGEGIKKERYFNKILDLNKNDFLKIIKIKTKEKN